MASDIQSIGDVALAQAQATTDMRLNAGNGSMAVIDHKSKEFESVFMSQMLQPMFEGIKVDPMFGGGHGEEVMKSFLVQEYGKAMSARGGLGIAAAVKNAMLKAQESRAAAVPSPSLGAAYATAN